MKVSPEIAHFNPSRVLNWDLYYSEIPPFRFRLKKTFIVPVVVYIYLVVVLKYTYIHKRKSSVGKFSQFVGEIIDRIAADSQCVGILC